MDSSHRGAEDALEVDRPSRLRDDPDRQMVQGVLNNLEPSEVAVEAAQR